MTPPPALALVQPFDATDGGDPPSPADAHLAFCAEATNDAIVDEIAVLAARVTAATCRLVLLAAEIDRRGIWGAHYAVSVAHWLSWRLGIDATTAREYVRVGYALHALPEVLLSFSQGRTSYSKVRAITRVALPNDGIDWVAVADSMSAARLDRLVRSLRIAETGHHPWDEPPHRVELRHEPDGSVLLTARMPAEDGAIIARALEAWSRPPVDDASADAPDQRRQPRLDALVAMARACVTPNESAESPDPGTRAASDLPLVVLHVDAEHTWIQDGGGVTDPAAERLTCEAVVTAIVHGRDGRAIDVGRRHRLVTDRLRRVIAERDEHRCRFPGCERTRFLDAHHVLHWSHGGATNRDNLLLLCDHHHRALHEHRYSITARGDERFTFHTFSGTLIPDHHETATVTDTDEPLAAPWMPDPALNALLPHLDTGDHRGFRDAIAALAHIRARSGVATSAA